MKLVIAILLLGAFGANAAPPPFVVSIPRAADQIVAPAATTVNYVLDRDFFPEEFTISLKTYLADIYDEKDRFVFNGTCQMKFRYNGTVAANQNKLTLHAKNLNEIVFKLFEVNTNEVEKAILTSASDPVTDKVVIELTGGAVFKHDTVYILRSTYKGQMDDDMHGFYRSQYEDDQGNKKWLASTQFQTHHARRAFPCFDEPHFKAIYKISINRHKMYNVAGNTRLLTSEKDSADKDRYIDTFEPTPKMSTYIIAFLVSEFLARSDGDFLVHARPEFYSQTLYAGIVGPKLLKTLDTYTNYPYKTAAGGDHKMAMAAIPDFSAGAMENWGLLTYRERSLLYDEHESSISSKQSIAAVIAHEQAHMWFGDLVTCDVWGYTWLNEGFARHWQYFITHEVHPEFEMDKQFPVDQMQSVFGMDSLPGTTPMSDPTAASPSDLSRMFNSISYNKGGAVLRQIKHAMGERNFQAALQEYLKEHALSNTVPSQLFAKFDKYWPVEDKLKLGDINAFFKSWTEQVGYPVVNITLSADGKSFSLRQERFLLKEKSIDTTSDRSLTYVIPITYTASNVRDFGTTSSKFYLPASTGTSSVILSTKADWVMANIQQVGYYRVFYDKNTMHGIHHALSASNHSGIIENNRAQFVDDLLTFSRAGFINYNETLKVLEFIENDSSYISWTSALNGLSTLAVRLGAEAKDKEYFNKYIRLTTDKIFKKLGFQEASNDKVLDIYNRNKILSWACKYGNTDCIKEAKQLFTDLRVNGKSINPNIRSAVYCTAMRTASEEDFDFLFKKWQKETISTEQTLLVSVMGCVSDAKLVTKYYNKILTDIRRQDRSSAITSLYSENDSSVDLVFDLITDSYVEFDNSFGSVGSSASTLSSISARFTTEAQKAKLVAFKDKQEVKTYYGSSHNTLENAVKTVEENLKWSEDRLVTARSYLKARNSGAIASISFLLVAFSTVLRYFLY